MTTLSRPLPAVRSDTLPENMSFRDDGCDVSQSCLSCPLSVCKYDDPGWAVRESRRSRDSEILRLRVEGVPVSELAARFSVSTRTVHRVLQRGTLPAPLAEDTDEGPLLTLEDLARRSLFRRRTPLPPLFRP
jgi:hypothetical protein